MRRLGAQTATSTSFSIQMGGAVNGDKYHNILFQLPGHEQTGY